MHLNRRSATVTVIVVASLLAVAGGAWAQSVPTPGTDDLGISQNDVRDEPNHPDDANNFPTKHPGNFWSPTGDVLILEAYTEAVFGSPFAPAGVEEDVSNVINVLVHGNNPDEYDNYMLPGKVSYEAYWGWWSDTGEGGDLQNNSVTKNAPGVGNNGNGAIDDADDCRQDNWDEFTFRGGNGCAPDDGHKRFPADQMFAFVQPGTHDMHINSLVAGCSCPVDATLASRDEENTDPDFIYDDGGSDDPWRNANWDSRVEYDSSLVISTQVVTAVNPKPLADNDDDVDYDPFEPAKGLTDADHAADVDVYTSLHPVVEDAYRMAVWDPPQDYGDEEDEKNLLASLQEGGLKAFAKGPGDTTMDNTETALDENQSQAVESAEPVQGFVDDFVPLPTSVPFTPISFSSGSFGAPYQHEPNTAADEYNGWATFGPNTTYGGLDDDYYEPGSGQTYTAYQNKELLWVDGQVGVNDFMIWLPQCCFGYGGWENWSPEIPSASSPAQSISEEGDDDTQGPGVLYLHAWIGTWYDSNEDTWIGDAYDGTDDDYDNGVDEDPNDYGSSEFRGTGAANITATLRPTKEVTGPPADDDGDGIPEKDWGRAGVYVMRWGDANPYSDVYMQALGNSAQPVGDAVRNAPVIGEEIAVGGQTVWAGSGYWFPDQDGRLSKHRLEGPINTTWFHSKPNQVHLWDSPTGVLFPGGNFDFPFKANFTVELADKHRRSQHGANKGMPLQGQTITDIDKFVSIQSTSES